jgi:hypothetical protein
LILLIERVAIERKEEADWVKLRESLRKGWKKPEETQREIAVIESTAGSQQLN